MAANPVVWFEIPTQDIARARAFYETVLGVPLARADTSAFAPTTELWMFPMDEHLREQRDRVNAAVMADPRLPCPQKMPESETPFDARRMFWGGFGVLVER
jgi:catechol 2,3-dioxygenase-like lactoylglutathione lyase family enzyme